MPKASDPKPLSRGVEANRNAVGSPGLISDHALLKQIGEGSYGQVWLARNVHRTISSS